MRAPGFVAVVVLCGCASGPKPPAPVPSVVIQRAPPLLATPAPDPSPSGTTPNALPAPAPVPEAPPIPAEREPTATEKRQCAARGGTIQPVCMLGELTCVLRYRDGGKRCTDKHDCTGECLYEGPDPPPANAVGTCQRTSDPCGCKAPMHNGHVDPALCAD